ncbi:OmpA family protein [Sunxiuqinia sp. A32]|uniref:OmpA family protein n=1 Tax=Sunxiuqinia sp. A32 TaxID=3461496 RepID=UPI0040467527
MKRYFLLLLVLSAGLLVNAQTADKKWGLGLGAGAYGNFDKDGVGLMPELYLSRYVSPTFDLMLVQNFAVFNSQVQNNLDAVNTLLNLRLKLYKDASAVKPYIYGGPGLLFDNGTEGLNLNVGVGSKFSLSESVALFVEGGYIDGITYQDSKGDDRKEDMWKVVGGIEISMGKAKDSDGDGVPDKKDDCPETPFGVTVDENGCPVDTDGDGVVDYIDDCPQVAGLTSLKGCPDNDGDGVADKDDECPEVAGKVELKGCPDSDGDGIADGKDKCADTPAGWKVDSDGCPLDSDGDGVADGEDKCPNQAGVASNNGCPEEKAELKPVKVDLKVIPVYFVVDKSYLTDYSKGKLDDLMKVLKSNPSYVVDLYGYTDDLATEEYNVALSAKRIDSVVKYMIGKGLDSSRITKTEALGEANPAAPNESEETRKLNRRVEFELFEMK